MSIETQTRRPKRETLLPCRAPVQEPTAKEETAMVAIDVRVVEAEGKGMVAVMAAGVVVAETEEVAVTESREPEGPGMNTKIRVEATEAEDVVEVVTL